MIDDLSRKFFNEKFLDQNTGRSHLIIFFKIFFYIGRCEIRGLNKYEKASFIYLEWGFLWIFLLLNLCLKLVDSLIGKLFGR